MQRVLFVLTLSAVIAVQPGTAFTSINARGRKLVKRMTCTYGDYVHDKSTCCNCPPGHYVIEHCNAVNNKTKCEACKDETFNSKANSKDSCERCISCNEQLHQEQEEICTPLQNRKCKCMDGYFSGSCEGDCACHPCKKCEGDVIIAQCTAKNNTVCGEARVSGNGWIIPFVSAVIAVVIIIAVALYCLNKWKRLLIREPDDNARPIPSGVDLEPHLYDIAEELGPRVIRKLATRAGVHRTRIEKHMDEHPQDVMEQSYGILRDWYQQIGQNHAFPQLITFLRNTGKNKTANELENLILRNTSDESALLNMNGHSDQQS